MYYYILAFSLKTFSAGRIGQLTTSAHIIYPLQASAELEAKRALLQKDESLYQMYKDLVMSGIISAEEFWNNRQVWLVS